MSAAPSESDPLAQERDAKFKKWLQNKAIKDKAFEYLAQLDNDRARSEDTLIPVGVALCAVDRMLGGDEDTVAPKTSGNGPVDLLAQMKAGTKKKAESASSKKTLKSGWMKWAMEFYNFNMLHLSRADVATISDAVKEFLFSEADLVASSGAPSEEIDRASKEKNILPSLKYFFPAVPKPNEKPKPLSNDQKAQNVIFMRELRKLWYKAQEELDNAVVEFVAKGVKAQRQDRERQDKEGRSKTGLGPNAPSERVNVDKLARALESQCLHDLSLKRLRMWIEEDEDKKLAKDNEDALEKLKLAKTSHEQFVKKKDSLRIRMPNNMVSSVPAPMSYGTDMMGVRPENQGPKTTVELMAGTGLKYVHATNKGRTGMEGDLERSRNQLLKMGFVAKQNFNEEEMDRYHKEKESNVVVVERRANEAKLREESAKAYDDWVKVKEMKEQALKCLKLIPKPALPDDEPDYRVRRSTASLDSTSKTGGGGGGPRGLNIRNPDHKAVLDDLIDIGKALKCVDRTLFFDFAKWCDGVINNNTCQALWDFFEPRACDVHSAAFSQVRDTFMKLLRPGVDYKAVFMAFVEKNVLTPRAENIRQDRKYYRQEPEDQHEIDREIEDLKQDWLKDVNISKSQMRSLLKQMGIIISTTEMRTLVDSFDANGDGVVTLTEFLDFIGPKRDRKGGTSTILNQRCCWMTTCRLTGMPNGYTVSLPTKRYLREEEFRTKHAASLPSSALHNRLVDTQEEEEENYKLNDAFTGQTVIKKMANGEQRMCVELVDRKKREELLRRLDLLAQEERTGKSKGDRRQKKPRAADDYEEDAYEDEPEEHYSDDGDHDAPKANDKKAASGKALTATGVATLDACPYSRWSFPSRKEGLKYLLSITRDAREEEQLRGMLTNGSPPSAPQLWSTHDRRIQTRSVNRFKLTNGDSQEMKDGGEEDEDADPSTSITVFWSPAAKADLVSFYSLEFGGPMTSVHVTNKTDATFKEIFRDPVEAGLVPQFHFRHVVRDLQPGTVYKFRIRAFNGFGPSEYTYKHLSTTTTSPLTPKVLRLTPDSVSLRWTFSDGFFQCMEELKAIFVYADRDRSGTVSREELAACLDDKTARASPLRAFLEKIVVAKGMSLDHGCGVLFDMIEGDDDGGLSWAEFEAFFLGCGWAAGGWTAGGEGDAIGGTLNRSRTSLASTRKSTSSLRASGVGVGGKSVSSITYVVEKCENEFDDVYKEVLRTSLGYGTVSRLEPGKSYRLRVYALNADERPGPPSAPVLVHTLLETPAAPVPLSPKHVLATSITLQWRARTIVTNTRADKFIEKMVGDWTHSDSLSEQGVSIEAAFAKYDVDRSGDIDAQELEAVLKDLGVEVSNERLAQAFSVLDANGDGVISYEEFAKWWKRDEVTYVLKRSEELPFRLPQQVKALSSTQRAKSRSRAMASRLAAIEEEETDAKSQTGRLARPSSAPATRPGASSSAAVAESSVESAVGPVLAARHVGLPVVVYRDSRTRCEVKGLQPNSYYNFSVRYVGARSNSALSPPLAIMTAPLPPSTPVLVDVTASSLRVKWYPGPRGAHKFVVMLRYVGSVAAVSKLPGPIIGVDTKDKGWYIVYNGPENCFTSTTLTPEMIYEVRVFAANFQGSLSAPSDSLTVTMLARDAPGATVAATVTTKTAAQVFSVECTRDICVGDMVMFTERLFLRPKAAGGADKAAAASTARSALRRSAAGGPGGTSGGGMAMLQQSVTSLVSSGGVTITAQNNLETFIGERTVAAVVVRDNYRALRDAADPDGAMLYAAVCSGDMHGHGHGRDGAKQRRLWLEIVWQRSSSDACRPYELKPGDVVERAQESVEKFEVFRAKWRQEALRKPLLDEWLTLQDCYLPVD